MLHLLEGGAANLIRMRASGMLTDADHQAFLARIHEVVEKYGKARVFCEVENLQGWDSLSAWDDATLCLRDKDAVARFAVVGKETERKWMQRLTEPFLNGRLFTPEQAEEAWQWAAEGAQEEIDREWIRRAAYTHWEAAGCPPNRSLEFWVEAEQELLHQH